MPFAIQADGTIHADTLEEALEVRRAILQRSGASKGGSNRWKNLTPEHRAKLSTGAAASSRAHFARNPGKGSIREKNGKFNLMVCVEGKARWAGTWPTQASAEDAQTKVLEARRAGQPLPDFVRPHRSQHTAVEQLIEDLPAEEESQHAPIFPTWQTDPPLVGDVELAGAPSPDQHHLQDDVAPAPPAVASAPAASAPSADDTGEPAPAAPASFRISKHALSPGPAPKSEASIRISMSMKDYWARKKAARAAALAAAPVIPEPIKPEPSETRRRISAGSVAYWVRWRAEHGKAPKGSAAPCTEIAVSVQVKTPAIAPAPLPPAVVRAKPPLPVRCGLCVRVGHVEADCPKAPPAPPARPDLPTCAESQTDPSCLTDQAQDVDGLARLLLAKGERIESVDHLLDDDEGTDFTDLVDVPDADPTVFPEVNLNIHCRACAEPGHVMGSPDCSLSSPPEPMTTKVHLPVLPRPPRLRTQGGYTENDKQMRRALKDANAETYPDDVERPLTRGDCHEMPRPCPFVSCSHHLYLDVNPESGVIKLNFPNLELWEMPETCSLDVADRGGMTLEQVGAIMNLTRERIRQVEVRGFEQIREHTGNELGLPPERNH